MSSKPRKRTTKADDDIQSVAESIKQNTPFRTKRHEAMIGLLLTVEAMRKPFQELFASYDDLTQQQFNVLRILRGAKPDGLPTLEISERMVERTPGITRLIDRLETKGLVKRERSATDRRQVFCHLTKKGGDLLRRLDAPVAAMDDELLGGLTDKEAGELTRMLNRVRHHIRGVHAS